jgi:hypothetical protein
MAKNIIKRHQVLEIKSSPVKNTLKQEIQTAPTDEMKDVTKMRKNKKVTTKPLEDNNNVLENNNGDE